MTIRAGVGISHHRNPKVAGSQAARQALEAAGITRADFVLAFATVGYDQRTVVRAIREATDNVPLSGCSAEGVITGGDVDESNFAVAVMVVHSPRLRFTNGIEAGLKGDPRECGGRIASGLAPHLGSDSLALFLFPDGITVNYDGLKGGIAGGLPPGRTLPFFGGAAGDNWKFRQTYQYCDDQVLSDGVAWALMSGEAHLSWGVGHGCVPVGVEHRVTRASGNTIHEIDGRSVLEVLKSDYLTAEDIKDWAKTFQTFTLGLQAPRLMADYDQYIIRTMVGGIDQETGSVTLATEVATGQSIWVARRDFDKLASGNRQTVEQILNQRTPDPFAMVFQFECIGRGKVFVPDRIKGELIDLMRRRLGEGVPWIGFYTFGEIGPVGPENHFHNESMVLLTVQ